MGNFPRWSGQISHMTPPEQTDQSTKIIDKPVIKWFDILQKLLPILFHSRRKEDGHDQGTDHETSERHLQTAAGAEEDQENQIRSSRQEEMIVAHTDRGDRTRIVSVRELTRKEKNGTNTSPESYFWN